MSNDPSTDSFADRVTREPNLPAAVTSGSRLDPVDYADAFRTTSAATHGWSSRRWAEHVLASARPLTRAQLVAGWLTLGLTVAPGRAERVLGWTVQSQDIDRTLLGARSVLGMRAELVFARHQDAWWFGTRLALDTALARAAWRTVEPIHLGAVQRLLEDANARLVVDGD
ncbi:hypothetical protein F4692_000459 [Nocardioides cavernae]|uniref:DUF2867 domain-containing protein n=1 Tax=Nocardioides cavernae TaxID=1921566 RepID=A0A7Y9H048_9ACTN|nr:hypothetical protein [Nocardioides cavernae]NYE35355.1 hypothetical protein [Nocardioides cavernae]